MREEEYEKLVDGFVSEIELRLSSWPRMASNGARVAVVGSGPLGLACARFLSQSGFEVVVYEAREYAGGLLRAAAEGLPECESKLDAAIEGIFRSLRVQVVCGHEIDSTELAAIAVWYDVVYIAAGTSLGRFGLSAEKREAFQGSLVHAGDYPNVLVNGPKLDNPTTAGISVEIGEAVAYEISRLAQNVW